MFEPASSTGTSSNASPRHYDPVAGGTQKGNQDAPVTSSEYGLQRDPAVETDASANPKTYDRNVRPDPVAEDGSQDSSFERPVEPGTVEPGSYQSAREDPLPFREGDESAAPFRFFTGVREERGSTLTTEECLWVPG
jgi:hypothetical protein